jgi:predicted Ser/Thr protein kinase
MPGELASHFPDLEILELVGRGGMGVVYKARQKQLDRLVALKILAPKVAHDPAFAERFAREARAMAKLSHPHVVAVHDFGQTAMSGEGVGQGAAAPLYYFLMEYVDGVNLRRLLDTGTLTPKEALAIVPQICDALQYAHDHGVVHRDIKPENVLLDKEGRVKIADFGIAKLVGKEAKDLTLTGAGQIIGTPQYMAPEQIEHPLEVDHRADIYSLGVVFYQMLTGELPIGRFAPPSKKVQIDVRLDEVVLRALEKEPERRYQQASEVKTQVESIVTTPSGLGATADEANKHEEWRTFFGIPLKERPNGIPQIVSWPGLGKAFVVFLVCGLAAILVTLAFQGISITEGIVAAVLATTVIVIGCAWYGLKGFRSARGGPSSATSVPSSAGEVTIEEARRQVKAPAIGLLIVGMLNCLFVPLIALVANTRVVPVEPGTTAPTRSGIDIFLMIATIVAFFLITLFPGVLMIVTAVKMKRLRAYWLAAIAGILAILLSPAGFFIGLPIGIWSLVVLSQREVRTAFAQHRARPAGTPEARDSEGLFGAPQEAVPRLSKTALAGSIWAGPFFLVIVVSLCVIILWMTLSLSLLFPLLSPFLLLLLAAPICVTILGYVALKQIRRSSGLLYGLELALFDLLAFPLLALDAVIVGLGIVAVRASTGGLGGAVAFFLIVVACVAVDVLVVRWGWRTVNQPPAGALPAERPKRGGLKTKLSVAAPVMMFCLGVFGFAFLLWSVTERIENSRARIHTRIFEADAKLVDELVPRPTLQPAHAHDSALEIPSRDPQTAQVNAAVFARLLADGANLPGLLDDQTREGNWWPKQATSSHYFRRGKVAGDGYVDGFLGIWRQKDVRQLWAEFNGLHGMNSEIRVVKIVWEGNVPPPEAARAFFIPFSRTDGTARYLVIALEVGDETEIEEK